MDTTQVSINWWMDKESMACIHNGTVFGNKKDKILSFRRIWMELKVTVLNETSYAQKDKYYIMSLMWSLKRWSCRSSEENGGCQRLGRTQYRKGWERLTHGEKLGRRIEFWCATASSMTIDYNHTPTISFKNLEEFWKFLS